MSYDIIIKPPLLGGIELPVQHVHTYLVHPGKGTHQRVAINGNSVPLSGKMFVLLKDIYDRSGTECDIDITFRPRPDGQQKNDCRDLVLGYLASPTVSTGRILAERLRNTTDGRSGLGLLFLISGKEGAGYKIVISRFPTDSAIYVDEKEKYLAVEFLERVFMKNRTSYKAVAYEGSSLKGGFWSGRAIDKQLNNAPHLSSDYWISDFLLSEFTVTPAAGTRRLAKAIREAVKKSSLDVKQELIAAATLATGLRGQRLSIDTFIGQYGLSKDAGDAIRSELKRPELSQQVFQFDRDEFRSLITYRSVELDNGAFLTAEAPEFDSVFQQRTLPGKKDQVEFSTKGVIVNEKFKTGAG